jgi:hypothetical protein
MKKILIGIIGLSILMIAAVAFARPCGMGMNTDLSVEQQKFFDATRELRKEMHDKRFQMMELYRSKADQTQIDALQNDIDALRTQIQGKAQEFGVTQGPGSCAEQGANCKMGQGKGYGMGCNANQPCSNQQANRGCGMMGRCAQ